MTNLFDHSPAPWFAPRGSVSIFDGADKKIAEMHSPGKIRLHLAADAELIATAPAMLEYIKRLETYLVNLADLCEANQMTGTAGECTKLARDARFIMGTATPEDKKRRPVMLLP